jgi:hypothetical protein
VAVSTLKLEEACTAGLAVAVQTAGAGVRTFQTLAVLQQVARLALFTAVLRLAVLAAVTALGTSRHTQVVARPAASAGATATACAIVRTVDTVAASEEVPCFAGGAGIRPGAARTGHRTAAALAVGQQVARLARNTDSVLAEGTGRRTGHALLA